jgi:hypothetical protein
MKTYRLAFLHDTADLWSPQLWLVFGTRAASWSLFLLLREEKAKHMLVRDRKPYFLDRAVMIALLESGQNEEQHKKTYRSGTRCHQTPNTPDRTIAAVAAAGGRTGTTTAGRRNRSDRSGTTATVAAARGFAVATTTTTVADLGRLLARRMLCFVFDHKLKKQQQREIYILP